ncbi:MAG: hypothetical protein KKB31_03000 [Nanoarchaeota archaeon]|nr:hypothetical protein [Nanoarchaeota archaeon]
MVEKLWEKIAGVLVNTSATLPRTQRPYTILEARPLDGGKEIMCEIRYDDSKGGKDTIFFRSERFGDELQPR